MSNVFIYNEDPKFEWFRTDFDSFPKDFMICKASKNFMGETSAMIVDDEYFYLEGMTVRELIESGILKEQ